VYKQHNFLGQLCSAQPDKFASSSHLTAWAVTRCIPGVQYNQQPIKATKDLLHSGSISIALKVSSADPCSDHTIYVLLPQNSRLHTVLRCIIQYYSGV